LKAHSSARTFSFETTFLRSRVFGNSSLGYRPPAPEAWLKNDRGHGEVETATRFPLLHTPDGGYLNLIGPGNFEPDEMLVFGKI
jgi:hypothetical protein